MPKVTILQAREKERRAVAMHLAGETLETIAATLGYASPSGPHKAIVRALERDTKLNVEELRQTNLARIDRMIAAVWPSATADLDDAEESVSSKQLLARLAKQHEAVDRIIKLMQQQARYVPDLEAPTKIDATIQSVTPDEFQAWLAGAESQFRLQQERESQANA